ncbi:murein biosynthesis integral membrane protein MurJ [Pseudoalteromonas sp. NBT06-2]|uniref:murein biosynthesis integral membrane protein MurJ n=1 Tax=Pseudoalteromonas sp. NBT06-2 TaxID=2025950 RepID=UPI000BA6DE77|nr:murein biosynthesis integral membrane protein MurJ [Pseudoalteromonas sp. NBT06-2]PAJ73475.1 murein biosynthesis integral membrane protein MurJ [Pseudoalteromonas sp. NBT06-2]
MAKSLFRSGMIVSFMTFLSRILGLVRDAVTAHLLGAGAAADIFLLANKVPNFLRRLFAEGAFAQAFVPVLTEVKEKHGDDQVRIFVANAAGTLGTILLSVTILGVIASPVIAALFGAGWFVSSDSSNSTDRYALLSLMLKFTFPYLFFISLVALSGSVLNVYNRFAVAAFTPVLLNISIIGCALFFHDRFEFGALSLALGVFIGGVVQILFQIPFLYRAKMLTRPKWAWQDENVKKVRKLMLPALFGVSVSQINLLLDSIIATFLIKGSIAWLYYSDRLIEFPLGLFGIGIATVILPALSKLHVKQDGNDFQNTLDWGVRFVIWLGLPAFMGLIVLSPLIITVLFGHGAFINSEIDHVTQVSFGVAAYAVGLLSFMLIKVLAPGFYARHDTKTPVKIGIAALILNMIFNLILASFLGYIGLALATSLSATCNAFLLYYFLSKQGVYKFSRFSVEFTLKCIVSSLTMAFVTHWCEQQLIWQSVELSQQIVYLLSLLLIAIITYFSLLYIFGIRVNTIKNVSFAKKSL